MAADRFSPTSWIDHSLADFDGDTDQEYRYPLHNFFTLSREMFAL
jgi:hypothetical protein